MVDPGDDPETPSAHLLSYFVSTAGRGLFNHPAPPGDLPTDRQESARYFQPSSKKQFSRITIPDPDFYVMSDMADMVIYLVIKGAH
jgi:hypothetical protein